MRKIDAEERRTRLARRHRLAVPAPDVAAAAAALVGLHSSDPATPYLSARARVPGMSVADLETALYERRSLLRIPGMRKTLFAVPTELAAVIVAACARPLAPAERRRTLRLLEEHSVDLDPEAWLDRIEAATLAAVEQAGEAAGAELTTSVPELAIRIPFGEGTRWEGTMGLSTRVFFLLALDARLIRARPRGSWISSQYRWTTVERWIGHELETPDPAAARTELIARWLAAYGPGTRADVRWWTGFTAARVDAELAQLDAAEVRLDDGATGFVLPDDAEPPPACGPWVALLPSLDSTTMGWQSRGWYLGDHGAALFDRNGNAGPTVWADGRIVGGWAQTADASVVVRLLEDVGREAAGAIEGEAAALTEWLDGTRITPRFRTPLDRELAG